MKRKSVCATQRVALDDRAALSAWTSPAFAGHAAVTPVRSGFGRLDASGVTAASLHCASQGWSHDICRTPDGSQQAAAVAPAIRLRPQCGRPARPRSIRVNLPVEGKIVV